MSDIDYVELITNTQRALQAVESARHALTDENQAAYLAALRDSFALYRDAIRMIEHLIQHENIETIANSPQSIPPLLAVRPELH